MPDPVVTPPVAPVVAPVVEPPAPPVVDKTFSQADVDRIVQERVARVKTEAPADYEAAKAAMVKLAQLEEADKTDLQKALDAQQAAEATATEATTSAKKMLVKASIIAAAAAAGAADAGDVHALLMESEHKNAVTIGDDGQVTGADDAVKALLEAKPHLVGKPATTPTGSADGGAQGGPGPTQLTRDDLKTMTPEAIVEAKAKGQLNTLLGVTTP